MYEPDIVLSTFYVITHSILTTLLQSPGSGVWSGPHNWCRIQTWKVWLWTWWLGRRCWREGWSSMGCGDPGAIGRGDIVSKMLLPDLLPSPQGKGTLHVDG